MGLAGAAGKWGGGASRKALATPATASMTLRHGVPRVPQRLRGALTRLGGDR